MKRIFSAILLLSLTLGLTQCKKSQDVDNTTIPVVNQPDPITATVKGNVVNENNLPVAGAIIKVGTTTVTTDATGYFRITNASLDKKASLVKVDKAGYFPAYRVFSATSGANQVTIKLIPKSLAGTVDG